MAAASTVLALLIVSAPAQADESLRASLDYEVLAEPYENQVELHGSPPGARAAVDRDPSSPYYGTIYAVGDVTPGYCDPECRSSGNVTFFRSSDGGRTFEGPIFLDLCAGTNETYCVRSSSPDIVVGNAGAVYIALGGLIVRSVDGGASWQRLALFEEVAHSSITVDPVGGTVHVASVNATNAVFVVRSLDAGQTWSPPIPLPNRTTTAFPQIASFGDSVVVAFTSPDDPLASVVVAASQDGGLTWPIMAEVSPPTMCALISPSVSVSPDGIFAVTWAAGVSWYADDPRISCQGRTAATFVSTSRDLGLSFSDPVEVSRYEGGAAFGFGDAVVFDDRSRLYVTWSQSPSANESHGRVFVAHASPGEAFSTASFTTLLQGGGANGTSYQHLAAGLDGHVYLTWYDFVGGEERNATTFIRGASGEASGDVVPETQVSAGTVIDVDLVDPETGDVRAQASWTGSPITLGELPPDDYDVRIQVGNASALAGRMPVRTWNRTAFNVHVQVVPVGPGPPPFPWMTAAAVGVTAGIAAAALVALQHTRLAREDILQRKVRSLIYGTIREHPGRSFTEVRDAVGLQNGVAAYHLRVLEKEGLVHSERGRGHRWYYPNGDVSLWRDLPLSPLQRALLEKVREAPGIAIRELARSLDRRHASIAYNVKGLAREGLLRTQRAGRKVRCFPAEDGGTAQASASAPGA